MEFDLNDLPPGAAYKLLTGAVVPRPIGWISTVDQTGRPNLAPYSFFNAVSSKPPCLVIGMGRRGIDQQPKDTWHNIQAVGEFVANIVTEATAEAMNLTSVEAPAETNEFEFAGLSATPSVRVRPPRVGESPVHFECEVRHILELGEAPGYSTLVVGEVVHIHVDERVLLDGHKIDIAALEPIGRLAGTGYAHIQDFFDLNRPKTTLKP
jgi:flavin reductase (DIM6/NTAB) family NADH-FMN oxidoreductase RutF